MHTLFIKQNLKSLHQVKKLLTSQYEVNLFYRNRNEMFPDNCLFFFKNVLPITMTKVISNYEVLHPSTLPPCSLGSSKPKPLWITRVSATLFGSFANSCWSVSWKTSFKLLPRPDCGAYTDLTMRIYSSSISCSFSFSLIKTFDRCQHKKFWRV